VARVINYKLQLTAFRVINYKLQLKCVFGSHMMKKKIVQVFSRILVVADFIQGELLDVNVIICLCPT
jgi:hypothetical protein